MKIIKSHSFKTQSGFNLNYKIVPLKDGEKLIKENNGKLLDQYSNKAFDSLFYLLNDNRVVHIPLGLEATIYSPWSAFVDHMEGNNIQKKIISSYPKIKKIILPDKEEIEFTEVGADELNKMQLKGILLEKAIHQLPNGSILKSDYNVGTVFKNMEEYNLYRLYIKGYHKHVSDKISGKYKGNLFWNLNGVHQHKERILDHIKGQFRLLPDILNAPEELFDFTLGNLSKIDKHLYKHTITYEFRKRAFMPLLVYLGQTYLKHSNGKWVLLHDGFNNLWIPDIRQADGIMKMLHHPLSIILDPEDGLGSYISLKSVCLHEATNPM